MKVIYLNQLAYGQLLHDWDWQENSEKSADFHAAYVLGEEEKGKAKIQVIADGVPDDRARAFCAAKKADLVDEECSIRVQMAGQKTDGMDLSRLTKAGFQVVNKDDVQMTAMQLEMQWLRLRCGCLVTALCLLAAKSLKKWAVGSGRR